MTDPKSKSEFVDMGEHKTHILVNDTRSRESKPALSAGFDLIEFISYKLYMGEIYVIAHNIRSALNVGSIFRTSDGVGVSNIYLTGHTPTPENPKVLKTSLGAEESVPWEKCYNIASLLKKLRNEKIQIVALELASGSIDYKKLKPRFPLALIVGNEVNGLSKNILKYADKIIAIPMYGRKESLNVSVAFGIVVYRIREFREK